MNRTRKGTRASGTNPRALGTNPRALGTNPRAFNSSVMTERSPKEELISAALELIDTQATQIKALREQQIILISFVAFVVLAFFGLKA